MPAAPAPAHPPHRVDGTTFAWWDRPASSAGRPESRGSTALNVSNSAASLLPQAVVPARALSGLRSKPDHPVGGGFGRRARPDPAPPRPKSRASARISTRRSESKLDTTELLASLQPSLAHATTEVLQSAEMPPPHLEAGPRAAIAAAADAAGALAAARAEELLYGSSLTASSSAALKRILHRSESEPSRRAKSPKKREPIGQDAPSTFTGLVASGMVHGALPSAVSVITSETASPPRSREPFDMNAPGSHLPNRIRARSPGADSDRPLSPGGGGGPYGQRGGSGGYMLSRAGGPSTGRPASPRGASASALAHSVDECTDLYESLKRRLADIAAPEVAAARGDAAAMRAEVLGRGVEVLAACEEAFDAALRRAARTLPHLAALLKQAHVTALRTMEGGLRGAAARVAAAVRREEEAARRVRMAEAHAHIQRERPSKGPFRATPGVYGSLDEERVARDKRAKVKGNWWELPPASEKEGESGALDPVKEIEEDLLRGLERTRAMVAANLGRAVTGLKALKENGASVQELLADVAAASSAAILRELPPSSSFKTPRGILSARRLSVNPQAQMTARRLSANALNGASTARRPSAALSPMYAADQADRAAGAHAHPPPSNVPRLALPTSQSKSSLNRVSFAAAMARARAEALEAGGAPPGDNSDTEIAEPAQTDSKGKGSHRSFRAVVQSLRSVRRLVAIAKAASGVGGDSGPPQASPPAEPGGVASLGERMKEAAAAAAGVALQITPDAGAGSSGSGTSRVKMLKLSFTPATPGAAQRDETEDAAPAGKPEKAALRRGSESARRGSESVRRGSESVRRGSESARRGSGTSRSAGSNTSRSARGSRSEAGSGESGEEEGEDEEDDFGVGTATLDVLGAAMETREQVEAEVKRLQQAQLELRREADETAFQKEELICDIQRLQEQKAALQAEIAALRETAKGILTAVEARALAVDGEAQTNPGVRVLEPDEEDDLDALQLPSTPPRSGSLPGASSVPPLPVARAFPPPSAEGGASGMGSLLLAQAGAGAHATRRESTLSVATGPIKGPVATLDELARKVGKGRQPMSGKQVAKLVPLLLGKLAERHRRPGAFIPEPASASPAHGASRVVIEGLVDFFTTKYPNDKVAKKHLGNFLAGLRTLCGQPEQRRARLYGRLMGLPEAAPKGKPQEPTVGALGCLLGAWTLLGALRVGPSLGPPEGPGPAFACPERVEAAAAGALAHRIPPAALAELQKKVAASAEPDPESGYRRVDAFVFLEAAADALAATEHEAVLDLAACLPLADEDGDGTISLDEFLSFVENADPCADGDLVSAAFEQVAAGHGGTGIPYPAALSLLRALQLLHLTAAQRETVLAAAWKRAAGSAAAEAAAAYKAAREAGAWRAACAACRGALAAAQRAAGRPPSAAFEGGLDPHAAAAAAAVWPRALAEALPPARCGRGRWRRRCRRRAAAAGATPSPRGRRG